MPLSYNWMGLGWITMWGDYKSIAAMLIIMEMGVMGIYV